MLKIIRISIEKVSSFFSFIIQTNYFWQNNYLIRRLQNCLSCFILRVIRQCTRPHSNRTWLRHCRCRAPRFHVRRGPPPGSTHMNPTFHPCVLYLNIWEIPIRSRSTFLYSAGFWMKNSLYVMFYIIIKIKGVFEFWMKNNH